jgi:hypothetical protein
VPGAGVQSGSTVGVGAGTGLYANAGVKTGVGPAAKAAAARKVKIAAAEAAARAHLAIIEIGVPRPYFENPEGPRQLCGLKIDRRGFKVQHLAGVARKRI